MRKDGLGEVVKELLQDEGNKNQHSDEAIRTSVAAWQLMSRLSHSASVDGEENGMNVPLSKLQSRKR